MAGKTYVMDEKFRIPDVPGHLRLQFARVAIELKEFCEGHWMRSWLLLSILFVPSGAPLRAQNADAAFFETKIRPVLATKCYACHSSSLKAPMGGLLLDTKAGLRKGGAAGPVIVPGKPDECRLLRAMSYTDPHLQMPPGGKLAESTLADFRQWIAAGAVDPRPDVAVTSSSAGSLKGMSIEDGRKWWAFQPVHAMPKPVVKDAAWAKGEIDLLILSKLEAAGLKPSSPADPRTLVRRVYVDLWGYKPTYEEVEAFAADHAPDAYARLIDRLLASPHYGEQWGRHWMDVARFAEDNPTSEATNPPYPFAWRYRDWIIEAINKDVPYDRFVKLQLAADQIPGAPRDDLRALGYLGAAPIYHKDQRLSAEVIGGFLTDDWDERVDAVSRGILGMSVACARCHDHKFDPIPTKDYYGLVGVFASTMKAERPLFDVDPKVELRYLWMQDRLFDLAYSANLLTGEASTVENAAPRVAKWKAEIAALQAEAETWKSQYPKLYESLQKYWTSPQRRPPAAAAGADGAAAAAAPPARRGRTLTSSEPFTNAVYDAAQFVDGSDANYTFINYKPGEARDFPVLLHGNVATPGDPVPRHFLSVLSHGDNAFQHGSGRVDLANGIFADAAPLAARVIVNRVWGWHFGRPLVATPSDFGTQGDKPTHPELLDDLAARFIAHGWSMKWLNREILLSAAYQQSSAPRSEAAKVDQINSLVWRMNPRRMDIEGYRDTLLRAAARLDETMYGPSENVDSEQSVRRTVYGRVSRSRLSDLLRIYDFPDPAQTAPDRDLTTSSLQQLFVMNSPFMHEEGAAIAKLIPADLDEAAKIRDLYRRILARDPTGKELDLARTYLAKGTLEQYARILLSVNEEIFWP
jgi:uncharacterized protein DUF1553/uncharacterized protein DUF1549/cytochrome c